MVREYEDEAVQQVTLFVDNALSVSEAKNPQAQADLERVISWAASLGAYYLEHGYAVALIVRSFAAALPVLHSPSGLSRLLTTLALLETVTPEVPFQPAPRMPTMLGNQQCQAGDSLLIVRPSRVERDRSHPPPIPGTREELSSHVAALSMDSPSDPAARLPSTVAAAHVIEAI